MIDMFKSQRPPPTFTAFVEGLLREISHEHNIPHEDDVHVQPIVDSIDDGAPDTEAGQ